MGSLHRLVKSAQHDAVKALLVDGVNANEVVRDQTPLELAICNGDVAMVSILIQAGADVNQGHPKTDRRPIDCAVAQPDLRIMDLLLAARADIELKFKIKKVTKTDFIISNARFALKEK